MMHSTPIVTQLGILQGRDAIYLDRLTQRKKELVLEGEINGALLETEKRRDSWIRFECIFVAVEAFEVNTIDVCPWDCASNFDTVEGSQWLAQVSLAAPNVLEFCFATYDHVIRIAAGAFTLRLLGERAA